MNARIVVTGGTGRLGAPLVEQLRTQGRDVAVLSRRAGSGHVVADLAKDIGIDDAVREADVVIHCATAPRHDARTTATLLAALHRSAPRAHLVYVSIVGVDRVPFSYYREKLAVEQLIVDSGLDHTIQRATQFHDFLTSIFVGGARFSPFVPVLAHTSVQPVAVDDVARRLVSLVESGPVGWPPDFGGPQIRAMDDLAGAWAAAAGVRRRVVGVRLPGKVGQGYRAGGHLAPDHADGVGTFDDYLRARYGHAGRR